MEVNMRERESKQLSFADTVVSQIGGKRTQATLDQLEAAIDWESLAAPLRKLYRNDDGGSPAEPVVMMVRIVMLQKWFNLSDPQAEEQLNDRVSFRRFVGLRGDEPAPDETTIVRFRKRLREADADKALFEFVGQSVNKRGLLLKEGTMVDALVIEAPKGRKKDKTGAGQIDSKADTEKDQSGVAKTTRDPEASFTKRHGRTYHGYKGHVAVDRSGIVTDYTFSTASHHDSRYIDQLTEKEKVAVFADSAYADGGRRERLRKRKVTAGIIFKRVRGQKDLHPLHKRFNRIVARVRAGVEHAIQRLRRWGMSKTRYRGERRNGFDFAMSVIAQNIRRAAWLES
jgi:transposase, IS5 family